MSKREYEQEFREQIENREEYNLTVGSDDYMLYKLSGLYRVQHDADFPETFDRLEDAVFYLLMIIGYWKK